MIINFKGLGGRRQEAGGRRQEAGGKKRELMIFLQFPIPNSQFSLLQFPTNYILLTIF
ncbi:MAG: hypothetical protein F6J92_30530 [Symploca sp. SIO1A3]|nr:hypothetical protein [Symploca sp. SIO1A3]